MISVDPCKRGPKRVVTHGLRTMTVEGFLMANFVYQRWYLLSLDVSVYKLESVGSKMTILSDFSLLQRKEEIHQRVLTSRGRIIISIAFISVCLDKH